MAGELLSFNAMPSRRWFPAVLRRLVRQTHGQDLIEYGVLLAIVAAGVLLAVSQLGVKVPGYYITTNEALPGGVSPGRGGNPGNGNPNPGNPGNGNPGNGNPVGNPGPGNPGNGNPGGGKGK